MEKRKEGDRSSRDPWLRTPHRWPDSEVLVTSGETVRKRRGDERDEAAWGGAWLYESGMNGRGIFYIYEKALILKRKKKKRVLGEARLRRPSGRSHKRSHRFNISCQEEGL